MKPRLVIATYNPGKVREFAALLRDAHLEMDVLSLNDVSPAPGMPDETGATFEENARIKALAVAAQCGLPALADDSGLCVDALGGRPGIESARWAGPDATDADRNCMLLDEMASLPMPSRAAHYACAVALARPGGEVVVRTGTCHGVIITAPRGSMGFGYDPLFLVPELGLTAAELAVGLKNLISHRSRAFSAILPDLVAMAGGLHSTGNPTS